MDQFDEFTFKINNLTSFNNGFSDFISTFIYYNGKNTCKDDDNKYSKINNNFMYYASKSIILCIKRTQSRLRRTFKSIFFIITTFYLEIYVNMVVWLSMVIVLPKCVVRDIASNEKTKRGGAMRPPSFNSILSQDYSPIIILCISEGFNVGKWTSSTMLLFSDNQKL